MLLWWRPGVADAAGGEYLIVEYREPGTVLVKSACYMLALMDHSGKLTFRAVRQPALASCVFWTQTDLEIEKSVEKARLSAGEAVGVDLANVPQAPPLKRTGDEERMFEWTRQYISAVSAKVVLPVAAGGCGFEPTLL